MPVFNRADQDLPATEYDFLVVGAGLLGVLCAWHLRRCAPGASLLLIDQGGLPSEEGATHLSPAVHHHFFAAAEHRQAAAAWSETLRGLASVDDAEIRAAWQPLGYWSNAPEDLALAGDAGLERRIFADLCAAHPNAARLFSHPPGAPFALDPRGGCAHPEAVASHFARGAVRAGADLCLNSRAAFDGPGALRLERLSVNRRMEVFVERRSRVRGRRIIVAAGAWGAGMIEHQLGEAIPGAGRCYQQFPRIGRDPALVQCAEGDLLDLPVVRDGDFVLRPHRDGALLVPPWPAPDPEGYAPTGGRFLGVPVGLRRELLARLVARMDDFPALSWPTLNLGKTPAALRGAWDALPASGFPEWHRAGEHPVWWLAGGPHGFALGPACAQDLAEHLAL